MSTTSLFGLVLAIIMSGCLVAVGVAMLIIKIVEAYHDAHAPCSLEAYAEKHKCCYYCARCKYAECLTGGSGNFCEVTGKVITFTHRKRNCPIFYNKFGGVK